VAANKNQDRESRERLRLYTARRDVHLHQVKRRKRDNLIALLGALVVIGLAAATQVFYFSAGPGVPAPSPSGSASAAAGTNTDNAPDASVAEGRAWSGELTLNDIPLGITLDGAAAPQAVASLVTDITSGYLVGKSCHRLVDSEGFHVLQCGAVDATGADVSDYAFGPIENAPADGVYPTATIAMARGSNDAYSNGHQFFIVFGDTTIAADEAGGYTVVGTVTSGLDALQSGIVAGGITDGATDGAPVVATSITAATIQ
jgi:peptidyl-prolyl cis-trans isomerase B (cyclophilin B)